MSRTKSYDITTKIGAHNDLCKKITDNIITDKDSILYKKDIYNSIEEYVLKKFENDINYIKEEFKSNYKDIFNPLMKHFNTYIYEYYENKKSNSNVPIKYICNISSSRTPSYDFIDLSKVKKINTQIQFDSYSKTRDYNNELRNKYSLSPFYNNDNDDDNDNDNDNISEFMSIEDLKKNQEIKNNKEILEFIYNVVSSKNTGKFISILKSENVISNECVQYIEQYINNICNNHNKEIVKEEKELKEELKTLIGGF